MSGYLKDALTEATKLLINFTDREENLRLVQKAIDQMAYTVQHKGKIISCGNGGSMCDAMHFAEELTGRFIKDRPAIPAISISDPGHLSCVSNDFGYEHTFSRYLEAIGRPGDLLLGISTSGNSENVFKAFQRAKEKGINTVALLGKTGGKIKDLADIPIIIECNATERIQELHIKIIHLMIEGIERKLFPKNYSN